MSFKQAIIWALWTFILVCAYQLLQIGTEVEIRMKPADEITLLKLTIAQEAEGESIIGKRGIGWVIMNRSRAWRKSVSDVILAPNQFSCWNTDSPTRIRLDVISDLVIDDSYSAALDAYNNRPPDPTGGATHYLNEDSTRHIRGGTLPDWVAKLTKTVQIGKHTFYR